MRRLLPPACVIAATLAALLLAPGAGTAPAQGPEPTPSPQETPDEIVLPPDPGTPTPTPTPAPRLTVQPERRSVSRAALDGLRVRTDCAGGCALVRVRMFISPLTARQRGIRRPDGSRYTEEVLIGSAPTRRDADGVRRVTVFVKGAYQRRLATAKRLPIAVEAEATDAAGATRTALRRITLRR
jgi:hypothetical protein